MDFVNDLVTILLSVAAELTYSFAVEAELIQIPKNDYHRLFPP